MIALLDALRALGGRALSGDVYRWLETNGFAREGDLETIQSDGGSRFRKEVRFARKELYDAGLITNEGSGDWGLSDIGISTILTPDGARAIIASRYRPAENRDGQADVTSYSREALPTTGPIPVGWTATTTRNVDGMCWTYVCRFGRSDLWKIGQTENISSRVRELNRHLPVEIYQDTWGAFRTHPWPDVLAAYSMEQTMLTFLASYRTQGERVMCNERDIIAAWHQAISKHALG